MCLWVIESSLKGGRALSNRPSVLHLLVKKQQAKSLCQEKLFSPLTVCQYRQMLFVVTLGSVCVAMHVFSKDWGQKLQTFKMIFLLLLLLLPPTCSKSSSVEVQYPIKEVIIIGELVSTLMGNIPLLQFSEHPQLMTEIWWAAPGCCFPLLFFLPSFSSWFVGNPLYELFRITHFTKLSIPFKISLCS